MMPALRSPAIIAETDQASPGARACEPDGVRTSECHTESYQQVGARGEAAFGADAQAAVARRKARNSGDRLVGFERWSRDLTGSRMSVFQLPPPSDGSSAVQQLLRILRAPTGAGSAVRSLRRLID
jgi:hypothetical protein